MTENLSADEAIDAFRDPLPWPAEAPEVHELLNILSLESLMQVLTRAPEPLRIKIAGSLCGPTAQGILARDDSVRVRLALTRSKVVADDVIEILMGDPEPAVRAALAAHLADRPRELDRLCADEHPIVRRAAAASADDRTRNVGRLVTDESGYVRAELAVNARISRGVLHNLIADEGTPLETRRRAACRSDLTWDPIWVLLERDPPVLEVLANPNAPLETLEQYFSEAESTMSSERGVRIQFAVAANPAAPPEMLERLWRAEIPPGCRELLAANPSLPTAVVDEILTHGGDENLQRLCIAKGAATAEQLIRFIRLPTDFELELEALARANELLHELIWSQFSWGLDGEDGER